MMMMMMMKPSNVRLVRVVLKLVLVLCCTAVCKIFQFLDLFVNFCSGLTMNAINEY